MIKLSWVPTGSLGTIRFFRALPTISKTHLSFLKLGFWWAGLFWVQVGLSFFTHHNISTRRTPRRLLWRTFDRHSHSYSLSDTPMDPQYPLRQPSSLITPLVVGLGVQWTPRGSDPPPDILQLCVGTRCLIIQLSHCKYVPDVLRSFLEDQTITFVGVWNSQDNDKLERFHHQLDIWRLVHIRHYLHPLLLSSSFETIVKVYLGHEGVTKDKELCMSNWGARSLSHDQIVQASHDVYVCCKLGVKERLWKVGA